MLKTSDTLNLKQLLFKLFFSWKDIYGRRK
jgi:hypothetical protein